MIRVNTVVQGLSRQKLGKKLCMGTENCIKVPNSTSTTSMLRFGSLSWWLSVLHPSCPFWLFMPCLAWQFSMQRWGWGLLTLWGEFLFLLKRPTRWLPAHFTFSAWAYFCSNRSLSTPPVKSSTMKCMRTSPTRSTILIQRKIGFFLLEPCLR